MNQPPKTKVFIEGRYRKLSRDLPQTVFYCPVCKGHPRRRHGCERCEGFGKITRDSVQELIAWVAGKAFGTRKNKFHGAGREDVDVRMLGAGRPFVLELLGPKIFDVDLAALEAEINRRNEGRLEVRRLHWTEKSRVRTLKETRHAKEYEALVELGAEPAPELVAGLCGERRTVVQTTPERVAHRRANLDRERWVEFVAFAEASPGEAESEPAAGAEADPADLIPTPHRYRVRLRTEHGTYVKEALSGEDGKSRPSLADLLDVPCRCVALDVLDILGEEGEQESEYTPPPTFGEGV